MPPIVIATGNPHKVTELRAIFAQQGIDVAGLAELGGGLSLAEPAETGTMLEENAQIKARSYAAQTGRICLADDSGLEVDALGGRPGVISSHFSTDGREAGIPREERDRLNNRRLLRELEGVPDAQRTARFMCVMCVAAPDGSVLATARGTFEGRIGRGPDVPRGENGFGYDPLFLVAPDFERTSAELPPEKKNRLSHRGAAARTMAARIRAIGLPG